MARNKKRQYYDYSLVAVIIFLLIFGLVMIYSSSSYIAQLRYGDPSYFMKRQMYIALAGLAFMVFISFIDYHFFLNLAPYLYLASCVLAFLVPIIGKEINGQKRWLEIAGISFQPAEVVKIALILFLAVIISNIGDEIDEPKGLIKVVIITAIPAVLIGITNLSSGIIIASIGVIMAFIVSKRKWWFILLLSAIVLFVIFIEPLSETMCDIGLLKPYQLTRIRVWKDPESYPLDGGYQVLQGLYAIGSGGTTGKGLGESIQKLGFVPEAQNDMIFSIICEELGLIGAIAVIFIFCFMFYRFFVISNSATDLYGSLIAAGVLIHISIQLILNIAVVCNVIPNTGITLPFISYGGTSVLILLSEMGFVLSVARRISLD